MTKIVYNKQYGGFSLSTEAYVAYLTRKGISFIRTPAGFRGLDHFEHAETGEYLSDRDIERSDPDLVAVVEELGDGANGMFANLTIKDVPPGTAYRIQEYDGREWIETATDIEWRIA